MLAYRGIIVTHKMVHEWDEKFGRDHASTDWRDLAACNLPVTTSLTMHNLAQITVTVP